MDAICAKVDAANKVTLSGREPGGSDLPFWPELTPRRSCWAQPAAAVATEGARSLTCPFPTDAEILV